MSCEEINLETGSFCTLKEKGPGENGFVLCNLCYKNKTITLFMFRFCLFFGDSKC